MQSTLLGALLLLLCGGYVFPFMQAERTGPPIRARGDFIQRRIWLIGPDDRVMAFDGKELPQWPMPDGERPLELTFDQLVCGAQPDDERQPKRDPFLPDPHRAEPIELPADLVWQRERKFEPSFVASEPCAMIVFASGLVGWISLGIAVVIVERKP